MTPYRLLWLLLCIAPVLGGDVTVVETRIQMGEQGMIRACELRTPGGAFVLVPPPGWRAMVNDRDRSASFLMPEGYAAVRLRVTPLPKRTANSGSPDVFWRAHAATLFKGARATDAFVASALGQTGFGFELQMSSPDSKWIGEVALIPRGNDVVEVTLSTSKDHLEATRQEFMQLLNSLAVRTATAPVMAQPGVIQVRAPVSK
jgi:hypothetical protein